MRRNFHTIISTFRPVIQTKGASVVGLLSTLVLMLTADRRDLVRYSNLSASSLTKPSFSSIGPCDLSLLIFSRYREVPASQPEGFGANEIKASLARREPMARDLTRCVPNEIK